MKTNAEKVFDVIFGEQKEINIGGKIFPIKRKSSGLQFVETPNFLYIEQNPNKQSSWGGRARHGEKIMWVIQKPQKYIAHVVNGKLTRL